MDYRTIWPVRCLVVVALNLFPGFAAEAAVFVVNDTVDFVDALPADGVCSTEVGSCSLRAAVMESNASPGTDQIIVPAGTYPLDLLEEFGGNQLDEAGDLDLLDDVVLTGSNASVTFIEARGIVVEQVNGRGDRLFDVHAGVDATLERVTIQGGRFLYNESQYPGAGIANRGILRIFESTVRYNMADPADAGGLMNHAGAILIVRRSAIVDNYGDDCGGIDNNGSAQLENVTMSGNNGYLGGAICTGGLDSLMILSSTITRNSSNVGDWAPSIDGAAIVGSSIIAGNGDCSDPEFCIADCGIAQSLGKNLIGTDCSGVVWKASDLHGSGTTRIDARLADLALNGAGTPSHAPLPGSPAIDHVFLGGECAATDQRGVARPQDGNGDGIEQCDVGAFEVDRQCANGLDDDGDGYVDFGADPGCTSFAGPTEISRCQDGRDNDGDGKIDHDGGAAYNGAVAFAGIDPQCAGKPWFGAESSGCGLGAELALALTLWRARLRRTRGR